MINNNSFSISIFWILLIIISILFYKPRQFIKQLKYFSSKKVFYFFTIEIISLILSIHFRSYWVSFNSLFLGTSFLVTGWLISNKLLIHNLSSKPNRFYLFFRWFYKFLFQKICIYNFDLVGDFIQLIGFSLIWSSQFSFIFTILFFPISFIINQWLYATTQKNNKYKSYITNFLAIIKRLFIEIVRIMGFLIIPFLLFGLFTRNFVIFRGTRNEAISIITTLIQIETTFGTLFIALLLALVELTTHTFSIRLTRIFVKSNVFIATLFIAVFSLAIKFIFLFNTTIWDKSFTGNNNIFIDWVLLWTVLTFTSLSMV